MSSPGRKGVCRRLLPFVLVMLASVLLFSSLKLPLWQMRLEAPQYRDEEALRIAVHPDAMRGDLNELTVLNHYIGVHVPPTLPQFKWLPGVLIAGAVLTLVGGFLPGLTRRWVLLGSVGALAAAMLIAALQAKSQMHDIGHNRDQKTILVGVKDFTPPLLGTTKIAQFTVSSRLGFGAWLIGGALAMQLAAAWLSRSPLRDAHVSLAPGFSPVEAAEKESSAASAASRAPETVETVSTLYRAHTGLKPGANESAALS